jgi:hypothetical protein
VDITAIIWIWEMTDNILYFGTINKRVGVNNAVPLYDLDVSGTINTGQLDLNGISINSLLTTKNVNATTANITTANATTANITNLNATNSVSDNVVANISVVSPLYTGRQINLSTNVNDFATPSQINFASPTNSFNLGIYPGSGISPYNCFLWMPTNINMLFGTNN